MDPTPTRHNARGQAGETPGSPRVRLDLFWAKVRQGRSDDCWEWLAAKDRDGYGRFGVGGCVIGAHRVAYLISRGDIPDGMQIDHVCHNRSCCNPSHLRLATPAQNCRNVAKVRSSCGLKGATYSKPKGRWQAKIKLVGVYKHIGYFATPEEAHAAYCSEALSLHGEFACLGATHV